MCPASALRCVDFCTVCARCEPQLKQEMAVSWNRSVVTQGETLTRRDIAMPVGLQRTPHARGPGYPVKLPGGPRPVPGRKPGAPSHGRGSGAAQAGGRSEPGRSSLAIGETLSASAGGRGLHISIDRMWRGADLEHVQENLNILRIVLIPAVGNSSRVRQAPPRKPAGVRSQSPSFGAELCRRSRSDHHCAASNVDGCQNGIRWRRLSQGHDRASPKCGFYNFTHLAIIHGQ